MALPHYEKKTAHVPLLLRSSHKRTTDVERVKEMFKQVPIARIEELLENHDVHSTVEILIGETPLLKSDVDDDSDDLPVIDLTVSRLKLQK